MMRALFSAASGMMAQQLNIDTISNNLANVNTVGFKKVRVDFQDILYQTLKAAGAPVAPGVQNPTGLQVGLGVRPASTQRIFLQGDFQKTDNPLDVVIEGQGFFQISMPDGSIAYTRDGSFKRDSQGRLVTSDGFFVSPELAIPQDAVTISIGQDGTVSVTTQGQAAPQVLGQITLARFINPGGLESKGKNLFVETAASGPPIVGTPGTGGMGSLAQGFLESSNVQIVEELARLRTRCWDRRRP
ncbi:MAG: flagellar basal-body rod protein FlgG [Armatimonadetes bacterium]|nr:flagellar basal-body rod protein FlgG [Armatimonadota bacterium]